MLCEKLKNKSKTEERGDRARENAHILQGLTACLPYHIGFLLVCYNWEN